MEKIRKFAKLDNVDMQTPSTASSIFANYVSCIKIDGIPILPPLLTERDRDQMRKYRQQAIEVEHRINKYKEYSTDYSSTDTDLPDENFSTEDSTGTDNYYTDISNEESIAKFSESCQKDVLNMLEDGRNKNICDFLSTGLVVINDVAIINDVPSNIESKCNKDTATVHEEQTLIQFSPNGDNCENELLRNETKILVKDENDCDKQILKVDDKKNNNIESSDENYATANETMDCDKTPKKLIRSGSFTIEHPSPLLIAHIEKEKQKLETVALPKRKTWNTSLKSDLYVDEKKLAGHILNRRCLMEDKKIEDKKNERRSWFMSKKRSFIDPQKPKIIPILNRKLSCHKRKGWDLSNAKEKWTSIEHDIGKNKNNITKKFNSLPSSTSTSPNNKMFNTQETDSSNEPIKPKISPQKEVLSTVTPPNVIKTPDLSRNPSPVTKRLLVMSTPKKKPGNTEPRRIKGFVTPIRTTQDINNIPSREYSPKRTKSAPKNISRKKTDNVKTYYTSFNQESPYYFVSEKDKCMGDNSKINKIVPEKDENTFKMLLNRNSTSEQNMHSMLMPEKLESKFLLHISPPKSEIKDLFNKMQEIQKQQMDELLQRQKKEQELFLKKFSEQQTLLLNQLSKTYSSPETMSLCISKNNDSSDMELLQSSESVITECQKLLNDNTNISNNQSCDSISKFNEASQMYAYSSNDTLNDPNLTMQSDTDQSVNEITIKYKTSPSNNNDYLVISSAEFRRSHSDDALETAAHLTNSLYNGDKMVAQVEKNITVCVEPKKNACSQLLFPTSEQVCAANIICAAAKGYLTRRLLRTERVQNLIQTIKDTLLCAMELHHESVENIQPADIELHRRLIQQVTAACVAFHDMFFKLTTTEQMSVISHDRSRMKEKLHRPTSSRSTNSISTTTQKVLERKHRRESSADIGIYSNRSSFSRSRQSIDERARTKSAGPADLHQFQKTPTTSQEGSLRKSLGAGAGKKPWR